MELSDEEAMHADGIKDLFVLEKKGQVFFSEGRIKTYTLNAYIEHLDKIIQRSKS